MRRTPKLYNALIPLLKPSPWHDKRHLFSFAWMIVGLILSGKNSWSQWSDFVGGRARYAQSRERRIKRWLYNDRIEVLALYTPLIQNALLDWGERRGACGAGYLDAVEYLGIRCENLLNSVTLA
jgi:hypothetical protein